MRKKYGTPEQVKAWDALHNAINRGHLEHRPCEVCGALPAEAHHPDYAQPLHVQWLCDDHHTEAHGRRRGSKSALVPVAHRLRAEGRTYEEIATLLGVTKGTVYKWINRPTYR